MDKSRADILQIQKYLNGELDAKAMHQLEREAQDDPFLMDALEGYQMAAANQQPNLDMLNESLNDRVSPKVRRMIPWTTISIAAGVVGFMIVVGLLYESTNQGEPKLNTQLAEVVEKATTDTIENTPLAPQEVAKVAAPEPNSNLRKKSNNRFTNQATADGGRMQAKPLSPVANADLEAPAVASESVAAGTPLDEMIMGTIANQRDSVEMPATVAVAKRSNSQTLIGKAEGVNTSEVKRAPSAFDLNKLGLPAEYSAQVPKGNFTPQPDVKDKSNTKGITTGNSFGYTAPAESANKQSEQGMSLSNGFFNTTVSLNKASDDSTSGISKPNAIDAAALAHPQKGWVMYQLYLSQKCTVPVGQQAGVVEVKFTVEPLGTISNITVVKGLSPATNKKAVQLIADGPKWFGNANGKPEEKTLRLEFVVK